MGEMDAVSKRASRKNLAASSMASADSRAQKFIPTLALLEALEAKTSWGRNELKDLILKL